MDLHHPRHVLAHPARRGAAAGGRSRLPRAGGQGARRPAGPGAVRGAGAALRHRGGRGARRAAARVRRPVVPRRGVRRVDGRPARRRRGRHAGGRGRVRPRSRAAASLDAGAPAARGVPRGGAVLSRLQALQDARCGAGRPRARLRGARGVRGQRQPGSGRAAARAGRLPAFAQDQHQGRGAWRGVRHLPGGPFPRGAKRRARAGRRPARRADGHGAPRGRGVLAPEARVRRARQQRPGAPRAAGARGPRRRRALRGPLQARHGRRVPGHRRAADRHRAAPGGAWPALPVHGGRRPAEHLPVPRRRRQRLSRLPRAARRARDRPGGRLGVASAPDAQLPQPRRRARLRQEGLRAALRVRRRLPGSVGRLRRRALPIRRSARASDGDDASRRPCEGRRGGARPDDDGAGGRGAFRASARGGARAVGDGAAPRRHDACPGVRRAAAPRGVRVHRGGRLDVLLVPRGVGGARARERGGQPRGHPGAVRGAHQRHVPPVGRRSAADGDGLGRGVGDP